MVTTEFEDFNDELDECDWYTFPIEFQRMYILVIQNAQKPVTIQGFGNIFCTRDAMKKVNFNRSEIFERCKLTQNFLFCNFTLFSLDNECKFFIFYDTA